VTEAGGAGGRRDDLPDLIHVKDFEKLHSRIISQALLASPSAMRI
jgi:hypothetical protein